MKREVDWDYDEEESRKADNLTSDDESDDQEPWLKKVLNNLSKAVSRKNAFELLHCMVTSIYVLFSTSREHLLWKSALNTGDEHLRPGRVCATSS